MATITVRGLEDDVVRALKIRAAREGHSMEAEVRGILTAAANPAETEAGFGTFLADAFAGVGEITVADRAEFPEPVDLP